MNIFNFLISNQLQPYGNIGYNMFLKTVKGISCNVVTPEQETIAYLSYLYNVNCE